MSDDKTTTIAAADLRGVERGDLAVINGKRFRITCVDSPTRMTITRYRWYHAIGDWCVRQWRRAWQWVRG